MSKTRDSIIARELALAGATADQLEVLNRIEVQRERLRARSAALQQAQALKAQEPVRVDAGAPLPARLLAFAKLHPVAVAAAAGVALMLGPRKVIRWAGVALPLVTRFMR